MIRTRRTDTGMVIGRNLTPRTKRNVHNIMTRKKLSPSLHEKLGNVFKTFQAAEGFKNASKNKKRKSKRKGTGAGPVTRRSTRSPPPTPPPPPPQPHQAEPPSLLPPKPPTMSKTMTKKTPVKPINHVEKVLEELGLKEYLDIFNQQHIDMDSMRLLTPADINKMGITEEEQQEALTKALTEWKEDNPIKLAVFGIGKFQAPHIGHKKLVDTVIKEAEKSGGDAYLFTTERSNDLKSIKPGEGFTNTPGKNDAPLEIETKLKLLNKMFGNKKLQIMSIKTPFNIPKILQEKGYNRVILVAGSDRLGDDDNSYNKSYIPYLKNTFEMVGTIIAGEYRGNETAYKAPSGKNVRKASVKLAEHSPSSKEYKDAKEELRELMDPKKETLDSPEIEYYAKKIAKNMKRGPGTKGGSRKRKNIKRKTKKRINKL
tara:strand:+ start:1957 stop:3240 length:1284 start_codon:yes stop_codon:yes gene_type:complete